MKLRIGTKILIMLSCIAIVAVGVTAYLAYNTARQSLEEESFNKLTAVREMKANQIEDYFQQITDQVLTFSENRMIIDAMKEFKDGFKMINSTREYTQSKMDEMESKLTKYYQDEFLDRLKANLETFRWGTMTSSRFMPKGKNVKILQYLYIAANPYNTGAKDKLVAMTDNSRYSDAHNIYHPIIRSYLKKFGYYDIFLVDHETGHIVYTVFKEVDFGTSLLTGPYRHTNFSAAFKAARDADRSDFVRLVDFEPYEPSYNAPAAFIASPIFDRNKKIGVLLFQMPIDRINDIMTNKHEWSKVGLGESGETYIVAKDYKIRNQSRFLIEDNENYFKMIQEIGLPWDTINKIRNLNSTIGLQTVKTKGTQAALRGETGTKTFPDYRGVSVLSSYKPLNIPDVKWVIMSEIDEAEAFTYVYSLRRIVTFLFLGLMVVIVVVALVFSRSITRPLQELTRYSLELSRHDFSGNERFQFSGNLDPTSSRGDEVGVLAHSFQRMEGELEESIENLKETTSTKERMESELNIGRDIQMSMIPLIFPAFPDHSEFSVYATIKPAREVGGDFYDFYFIDEDWFCFCIGDVSGKGVPSALFMAVTKTLIKSRGMDDLSPASILTYVNDEISVDNTSYMFITIFAGILNIRTGEIVYTNAGHNPPYIKRKSGEIECLHKRHGPVIGVQKGLTYREDTTTLANGDILLLYTDGVTEARDQDNNFFSLERLENLLVSRTYESAESLINTTVAEVDDFQSDAEQFDDITVLAVQYLGDPGTKKIRVLEIAIVNDLSEINQVKRKFNTFAEKYNFPKTVSRKMNIVFDEMLGNIINYAYTDDGEHVIEIKIEMFGDSLIVTIADDGQPFNPLDHDTPDTEYLLEDRKAGGLGIHLVRNLMDKVSYQRRVDQNRLILVKSLDSDSSS